MSQEIEKIRAEAVKLKEVLEASLRSPALSESKTTPEQRIAHGFVNGKIVNKAE